MKLKTLALIAGGGVLCAVTGGLAAPAIGAAIGSSVLGLSGAAATSAGLAALGGGSLAAGGLGMAGGTAVVTAVAGGVGAVGSAAGAAVASGKSAKSKVKRYEKIIEDMQRSDKTKQAIIIDLKKRLDELQRKYEAKCNEVNATTAEKEELKNEIDELKKLIDAYINGEM